VEQIGGPPTPAIGFGAGLERLLLALELEGSTAERTRLDVFFVLADDAPREPVLTAVAELRRAGVSADVDYAGRSLRGQLTQAGRTGAHTVVIVRGDAATVRREGESDQAVSLEDAVATLKP
jgi:histidyl-tRNA synthetase